MSRKNKREYLNDYRRNEAGGYEYAGTCWRWENETERKLFLKNSWIRLTGSLVVMIAAGCLPAPGADHAPYVLIPYAAGILACALGMMAMLRLTNEKEKIRGHIYENSIEKMQARFLLGCIAPLVSAAGEVLYLVLHTAFSGPGAGFILLEAAAGLVTVMQYRHFKRMTWIREG